MNSQLSKPLKAEFHNKMGSTLPNFERIGAKLGGVVYRKRGPDDSGFLFIFLSPHSKNDSFTVEFATSRLPEYPFEILPGERSAQGSVRCRINKFLGMKMDYWWHLNRSHELEPDLNKYLEDRSDVHSALSKIPATVQDAIGKIVVALPQFLDSLE